uniref:Uncharacterized protein n=1 Tax=Amphiprion percula TaxID=161767 RepID=A0A3P8S3C9_AMPPE
KQHSIVCVSCLKCYTCVFPAISPLDCLKFPLECPAGQRCLSSVATGRRGALQMTMYEKSCAVSSQCGLSGQKYTSGVFFNYTNVCCDTDLPQQIHSLLLFTTNYSVQLFILNE